MPFWNIGSSLIEGTTVMPLGTAGAPLQGLVRWNQGAGAFLPRLLIDGGGGCSSPTSPPVSPSYSSWD